MLLARDANPQPPRLETAGRGAVARPDSARSTEAPVEVKSPSRARLLGLEIVIIATILCFGYFAWRTMRQQETLQQEGLSQSQSLVVLTDTISKSDKRLNELTSAVQDIAAGIAQSASKFNDLAEQLAKRDAELRKLSVRLSAVESAARTQPIRPHTGEMSVPSVNREQLPPSVAGALLPPNSIGHLSSENVTDYWMVPRKTSTGTRTAKIQPYGTTPAGVKVYDMDERADYIITLSGEWLRLPDSDQGR